MRRPQNASQTLMALPLLTSLLFVSGCSGAGNCSAIPLPEYDAPFTQRWLAETADIAKASALDIYLTDADTLRGDVRACKGKSK